MRKVWYIVKLCCVILLYILAVRYSVLGQNSADTATVMLEGGGLTGEEAEEICSQEAEQENPLPVCFWGERENAALSCRETGAGSQATELTVVGKQELVVPGGLGSVLEEGGCMIDTETAWELFRTEFAVGQILWCDGGAYRVCGTFESLEQTFIHLADQKASRHAESNALDETSSGTKLDNLSLIAKRDSEAEQFLMRYGLAGARTDFTFLSVLVHNLLVLLPLVLAGKLLWFLGRDFPGGHDSRRGRLGVRLAGAAVILAAIYFLWTTFCIPADMIPTKWSDFSFWTEWWNSQCKNFLRMMGSAQGEVQLMMLWRMLISVACNVAGIFLALTLTGEAQSPDISNKARPDNGSDGSNETQT